MCVLQEKARRQRGAQEHHTTRLLNTAWLMWVELLTKRRRVRWAVTWWQDRSVLTAFDCWQHYVALKRSSAASMAKVCPPKACLCSRVGISSGTDCMK